MYVGGQTFDGNKKNGDKYGYLYRESMGSLRDDIVWLGKVRLYLGDDMYNQRI